MLAHKFNYYFIMINKNILHIRIVYTFHASMKQQHHITFSLFCLSVARGFRTSCARRERVCTASNKQPCIDGFRLRSR